MLVKNEKAEKNRISSVDKLIKNSGIKGLTHFNEVQLTLHRLNGDYLTQAVHKVKIRLVRDPVTGACRAHAQ